MDGTEVAKVVAARYPGIHIVCMSGYTERAVGLLGARAVLLKKPFSLSELGSKLRAVFAAHNGTNALITGMTGMAQE
jgi:DNA-binding response OmpR family regulator